jgi:hypothetical protein
MRDIAAAAKMQPASMYYLGLLKYRLELSVM